ncbi:DExH-box ATP-dependent RNA helicase DExH8 [Telopea speciosissima]|uniref:DExH-box ATP-dependent RNA helicase DExH8 n=1 Tax=Telopea speciosissima TaxID=54955 RepID=UPI001CC6AA2D|nr:DExH-box ATP-dependent RNA helicase DExH8 [Telopea speciosissima]
MASPPPSPCSSSYSTSFSSSPFSSLPVMAFRDKIVEKILENRVTLIVGDTGCGKSSQVPQFLLDEGIHPILCTQPRRFAVVAVAKMVAKARNCDVGGEVGYHIGHSKVASASSKIVFKTAGVLLDEMQDKGVAALKYKVIILDEVHERSVESDLVLACVKQFVLKNHDLRVVLMSATADISRYRDYFKDLGRAERVEVLAIPSPNQQTIFQRKVLYLEQVAELLGESADSLPAKYCSGPSPCSSDAIIQPVVHNLIHDLVLHIHENEPDIEKSILVFLPTYQSLEQQWFRLKSFSSIFKVHILHRSIDTEQALMAMKIWKSHRKVILATNIAESSVTIPGVAFVIDSCRSLQIFWDNIRRRDSAELVWVSKSQAEQRKGRTGRTCDGQIYRLVTRSFFNKLNEFERPAILRLSLRQQVLMICCAESKAINDPKVLLQKALDPPDSEVVEDALSLLVHINALERSYSHRVRHEPTFYGQLLSSLCLSFDASVLILKFGDIGLLRDGILIGIMMDTQPLPIHHPFGQEDLFSAYVDNYFDGNSDNMVLGKKEVVFMGNLCAYEFWQRVFKDKHRLLRLKQLIKFDEPKATQIQVPKLEEEWCSFHNLVRSSLQHISEIYEDVLNSMHRFRPKFLSTSNGLPSYYDPYEFEHTCLIQSHSNGDTDELATGDEHTDSTIETRNCIAVPFVSPKQFQAEAVAEKLVESIKEIRVNHSEDTSVDMFKHLDDVGSSVISQASLCKFFINGSCNKGSQCSFSHSLQAKRPTCKFFLSFQGCRNGNSCFFSHDLGSSISSFSSPSLCLPEDEIADATLLLRLLPTAPDECILILDDTDFHFSSNLSLHCGSSTIICTTCLPYTSIFDPSLENIRILWGLSHPYHTIISEATENPIPWEEVQCVMWFANFSVNSDDLEGQKGLLQRFFEYLSVRILADTLYGLRVVLTMNSMRFSHLQVEKLARDCFFFLTESFPFDTSSFGEFSDTFASKNPIMVSRPVSYVFDLYPPTDIQFGDYATALSKCLHNNCKPV